MENAQTGDGPVRPLIVMTGSGGILDVSLMNGKAFRKSIEQGFLWSVDEETGRVLPYREKTPFLRLEPGERWHVAVVADPGIRPETPAQGPGTVPAEKTASSSASGLVKAGDASILNELSALLKRRKAELPEGSYTSYLFKQGPDKIRKKTGEEAVELILARTREETVSEAADLLYHMLVLLEALDIDPNDVFAELKARHAK